MPELPEVETIKRGLEPHLTGRTITDVRFFWDNTAQGMPPAEMTAKLRGQKVKHLARKGKFLVLRFDPIRPGYSPKDDWQADHLRSNRRP